MATCSTPEQEAEQDTSTSKEVTESKKGVPKAEQDFDFVEQPDQDLYCPVTLEILLEPHQTDCCGQHISEKAANRIIKDGKPCPMCKDDHFTTHTDKYFKRNTINKLRVYCLHKKSGCEWTGELGDLNNHSTFCPKRPWKCQYCGLESTFDVGTNEHTPNCAQYPLPCPNQCEIVTVPRCDAEKHLLACPLQLVECEFANVGCEANVPRRDLTRHITENAQHHLMSATLLNLRLTRELHQKMEEKDQQITELQQQIKNLDTKIEQKVTDLDTKTEQLKDLDAKTKHQIHDLDTKLDQVKKDFDTRIKQQVKDLETKLELQGKNLDMKIDRVTDLETKIEHQVKDLDTKTEQQAKVVGKDIQVVQTKLQQETTTMKDKAEQQAKAIETRVQDFEAKFKLESDKLNATVEANHAQVLKELILVNGFTIHEFTLNKFSKQDLWCSNTRNNPSGFYFSLAVWVRGNGLANGTHMSAGLSTSEKTVYKCTLYLEILNQWGDYGHRIQNACGEFCSGSILWIGLNQKTLALDALPYCAATNTQFLKDDCLKFRLYLKTEQKK